MAAAAAALVAKLQGSAAEREDVYAELLTSEEVELAVAVASPLCEVLCRPLADVDVHEFCRAARALAAVTGLEPARVGGECTKIGQCHIWNVYTQPDSALGAVLAKKPASLTAEDALTVACAYAILMASWSSSGSLDAPYQAAGLSTTEFMELHIPGMFLIGLAYPDDDRNLALLPLLLELVKQPDKLPDFALAGALFAIAHGTIGRSAVAIKLLQLDALAVYMDLLRQASPRELASASVRRPHGIALWMVKEMAEHARGGGVDISGQLLSCGVIDILLSILSAAEEVGEKGCNGGVICFGCLFFLMVLDGEHRPAIEDKIRPKLQSALRFCVAHPGIRHLADFGITASMFATVVAANLYGKDEGNTFGFGQSDIDGYLLYAVEMMRCEVWGSIWPLSQNSCRGLLSLCISDSAKELLLNSAGCIEHLIDGLLLEPTHPRAETTSLEIKAVLQRDYAECIQQLSLFHLGCEALKQDPAVVDALDALVERAWTEEAKDCARGALVQLTDRLPESAVAMAEGRSQSIGHVMVSYVRAHLLSLPSIESIRSVDCCGSDVLALVLMS